MTSTTVLAENRLSRGGGLGRDEVNAQQGTDTCGEWGAGQRLSVATVRNKENGAVPAARRGAAAVRSTAEGLSPNGLSYRLTSREGLVYGT